MSDIMMLSLDQINALKAQIRVQEKALKDARNTRLAGLLSEYVEDTVTDADRILDYSTASAWAGYSDSAVEVTVDDVKYTVSVTVTHVAEKDRRAPVHVAAVKAADEQKLTGDKRKKFIAERMKATEPANA